MRKLSQPKSLPNGGWRVKLKQSVLEVKSGEETALIVLLGDAYFILF